MTFKLITKLYNGDANSVKNHRMHLYCIYKCANCQLDKFIIMALSCNSLTDNTYRIEHNIR